MPTPPSPPATKEDIALLMEQMGTYYDKMLHAVNSCRDELHADMERWKDEMHADVEHWKEDVTLHFDFTVETIYNNLRGANKDDIDNIKIRLRRVEQKVGLAS